MLFIDPDGRDNIVYLYAADRSVTSSQLKKIAKQATANYATMGLKTQVKVFKGSFDAKAYAKLDKTDAVAVIGKTNAVINSINGYNAAQANTLKNSGFGRTGADGALDPEESQNPRAGFKKTNEDNIIAIATDATKIFSGKVKATFEETAAFLVNHGSGHNANMNHAGSDNGYDEKGTSTTVYVPDGPNVMSAGNIIVKRISSGKYAETLKTYITSSANTQPANNQDKTLSIQAMYLRRFGNNTPNATLPTQQ